ncbi:peroxiredoxin [Alcanivorax sp. JB21]|uniref:peroxiredoxin n=1 Tax=Alcanivorax limicola TaxID=2874102 RepID=UPI001CC0E7A9|nr:peroxiredoxin [Alcanivorax limicola]MBZ2189909.1 peroxiredoxin [Alcanivorax limicola]
MSKTAQLDKPIPRFSAPATGGQTIQSENLKGRAYVLYFYPKDSTPGCTTEGGDFRDLYAAFQQAGCDIFGVSKDSLKSHENFKNKQAFPFELISDEDETLCRIFDVIKLKKMYGREFEGIERSTFLVDASGTLRQEWRKVKVKGHVEAVLEAVQAL